MALFPWTACCAGAAALNPRPAPPPPAGKPRHRAARLLVWPGPGRAGTGTQTLGSCSVRQAGLVLGPRHVPSLLPRAHGPLGATGALQRRDDGGRRQGVCFRPPLAVQAPLPAPLLLEGACGSRRRPVTSGRGVG